MKNKLFESKGTLYLMSMQYLDIPNIYQHTAEGMDFMHALKVTEDIEIFGLKSIQILIEHHQKYWLRRHLLVIGLPQLIQLLLYFYWSNIVLVNYEKSDYYKDANQQVTIMMNIVSAYLILIELPVIWNQKLEYFGSIYKWVNWTIFVLIFVNSINTRVDWQSFWTI